MRSDAAEITPWAWQAVVWGCPLLWMLLLLAGCGGGPTPEQQRADAALDEARKELAAGDLRAGKTAVLNALELDGPLNRRERIAEETRLLGQVAASTASFDSALAYYARSLEEFRGLTDRAAVRDVTLRMAMLHRQMGEERKAFTMYIEALRLARVFHDEEGVRDIQWAMLPCARALDEGEEETAILRELLQSYTASGDVGHQAEVFLESGTAKYTSGSFDRAAEDFLRALMLADQAGDALLGVRATLRLAMTFEASSRPRDALASYGDCLKRADKMRTAPALRLEALIRVGNLYLRGRQSAEAARFFRAALSSARAMGNSIAEGYLLLQLGHSELETSPKAALQGYRAASEIFTRINAPAGQAYASLSCGHLFERNNQPNDALQYYKTAIEQSEAIVAPRASDDLYLSCEQAFFGTRRTPWYDDAIDILLQLGRYDEAFWYVDRRNNRYLFDDLGAMDVQPADQDVRLLMQSYRASRSRYIGAQRLCVTLASEGVAAKDQGADAHSECERAFRVMTDAAAAVAKAARAFEPFVRVASVGLPEIQKALPPGTALVEHILARRSLYAFVVTNNRSVVRVAAFEKDRVFDLAREFVHLLGQRAAYADSAQVQQAAIDARLGEVNPPLYEAFVRPLEESLAGVSTLIVILPHEVSALPLHALRGGVLKGRTFLAERQAISYLPSASSLLLPRAPLEQVREVVALGCAGGTPWDVEYELRDIRAFYKEVRLYFDQQASLATLEREKADVLHLALRFCFNDERPGNSYVVFSDGKSAETITHVPMEDLLLIPPSSAVVVSDLEDQQGGIRPAEPYLFLANGTQEVIFTSNPPSRKAKKIFGEYLYTALLTGANIRAAYRTAQLAMIKAPEFAQPHNWAPIFLWGK